MGAVTPVGILKLGAVPVQYSTAVRQLSCAKLAELINKIVTIESRIFFIRTWSLFEQILNNSFKNAMKFATIYPTLMVVKNKAH